MLIKAIFRRIMQLPGARFLWGKFPIGPLGLRVRYGIAPRPHYTFGVYRAAQLAKRLGLSTISAIEFGVVGGNGLVALENTAAEISRNIGVKIEVFGFDSGTGMPKPVDYRDLPYVWGEGFYQMDEAALRNRLKYAELVIGDVGLTTPALLSRKIAPIGFIAFDLDYYSSTKAAFQVFSGSEQTRLPRIYCYFDDILDEIACHNEFIGELCAIREFNAEHLSQKICPIHLLRKTQPIPQTWHEQIYVMHDFAHSLYCTNVASDMDRPSQLDLIRRR